MVHVFALLAPFLAPIQEAGSVVELGSRRELFVDRALIETLDGARLRLGTPRDEGAVHRFDRPWEGAFSGYCTVIRDGARFLLYYRGLPVPGRDGTSMETTCMAESADGIRWTRPELGLFEVHGTKANNVILAEAAPVTHNFCPFLDARPEAAPERRFKALGGAERSGLIAYASPDGVHWTRMRDEPVITEGKFDSQNVSFWSAHEGRYVCYFRTWTGGGYDGFRTISRTTSEDFVHWDEPREMTFGETPPEHLYTNQTHPYFRAPHLYVGIAARFLPGRQVLSKEEAKRLQVEPAYFKDCSDAVLLTTRGGGGFDRTFMEGFIRPGIGLENWASRSNYPALGIVQTGPAEMSIYVGAKYAQPGAELRRYSLRLDGLASVSAGFAGGEMVTRPFTFVGERLLLNFSTSAAGGVRVEIQDADGEPLPGFTLDEAVEQIGDEIERAVTWRGGGDVSGLQGRPVRLHLVLRDADVFALRFAGE